ncbi:hypothetical protein F8S13_25395 [Chloroflexia bacterium SDU3-3]|nr:hypothetical protein F8S13_25395 [Chloroflexia bacterium SDU3-3]
MKETLNVAWRIVVAMITILFLIAGPVYYILFAENLLAPGAVVSHILRWEFVPRLAVVLGLIMLNAIFIGHKAKNQPQNPFLELAENIRRIAMRDFNVRATSLRAREPREMAALNAAFNDMASALQRSEELRQSMMADVSHELRTPLTVLEGNLRAVLDGVLPLDEAEIANLYGQTRHLIRLVNDLHELALAEAQRLPLSIQPTDMAEIIHEAAQDFALMADERRIALHAETQAMPPLPVDAVRMRQVLHNIISNAIQHTPAHGAITLSGGVEDGQVVIRVRDTGDGLEPEQLHAVFNRFYRADKSRSRDTGGTGLGLAIVHALVASMGGAVEATSAGRGQGTTFTLRFAAGEVQP